MKRKIISVFFFCGLIAFSCSSNESGAEKDPSTVQPPSEAITDSTKIVNDSVIVPSTTPGSTDSAQKK